ncbi:hypothetical protein [Desulfitobacterium chlororespirans]|uniref:hypothetical protein n=1 Tax=Desulfitobacterium chlororespirans TaxID=51616 RepID=UPI001A9A353C|nr:hypothetical protein [Desulfitobacterium chlororespirans]
MPVFALELGGTEAWAGMVTGMFTLASVIMRPITGFPVLCFYFFCVSSTALGWGASSTASSTIATDIIPKARMGEGMGYFGLTGTLAMAVGPDSTWALAWGYALGRCC